MSNIKLGYEIETGNEVFVKPSHLIVTGITQLSGKTTTLEALIKRSGLKAIVFKTKIGEKSFTEGTEISPYFKDRSDYDFVKSLIEAYAKEKIHLEKGALMQVCKGAGSLIDIKKRVDDKMSDGKLRGLKEEIYIRLQHYLENLIPQIQYANFSKVLNLVEGINIMNLERFTEEAQSLIIESVANEVLKTSKDVILVIPEAWKFLPQSYNNPCKLAVISFIRQGATNNNFIWIDSQDMAGVDKSPLKQISTWILGYQAERNEVKHTLDQISLPKKSKPKEEEIMSLKKGHFFVSSYEGVKKVYVQALWINEEDAIKIAKGEMNVEDFKAPNNLIPFSRPTISPVSDKTTQTYDDSRIRSELIELRADFFTKIDFLQVAMSEMYNELYNLKGKMDSMKYNEIELISKILQKMPTTNVKHNSPYSHINEETLITKVIEKLKSSNIELPKDMLSIWIEKFGQNSGEVKILKFLASNNGKSFNREQIALALGYSYESARIYSSKLKTANLIKEDNKMISISPEVFK